MKFPGVEVLKSSIFWDDRGRFVRLFDASEFEVVFVEDDISVNRKRVLRGIHGDEKTWKLISCLQGEIYLVVVDADPNSFQYRKWDSLVLSSVNGLRILIPPKFGVGYETLTDQAIVWYKQSSKYGSTKQFTIRWDEESLGIEWPIKDPILSERDANA